MIEVQNSILKTEQLVSALEPLKLRTKMGKIIEPAEFVNDGDNTTHFTHLYMTSAITNHHHHIQQQQPTTWLKTSKPTQRSPSSSLQTHKKHVEVVSKKHKNHVHANYHKPAISKTKYYKAVTDPHIDPTFRELWIQDDAFSSPAQESPGAFPKVLDQQATDQDPELVVVVDFARVTIPSPLPQQTVPLEIYEEKPPIKAVKLVQTAKPKNTYRPMIDFDGDRTGLKSHLYDRNEIYNNIVKRPIIKGDFKEIVITDPPDVAPPDLNTEFSYQRDILPLLVISKIPLQADPEKPKLVMGSRDFGLADMDMLGDVAPYNKNPSADNLNLRLHGAILKQLYHSGNPMKELQDALLFDGFNPRTTTENLDLSLFMLPEKRRFNNH